MVNPPCTLDLKTQTRFQHNKDMYDQRWRIHRSIQNILLLLVLHRAGFYFDLLKVLLQIHNSIRGITQKVVKSLGTSTICMAHRLVYVIPNVSSSKMSKWMTVTSKVEGKEASSRKKKMRGILFRLQAPRFSYVRRVRREEKRERRNGRPRPRAQGWESPRGHFSCREFFYLALDGLSKNFDPIFCAKTSFLPVGYSFRSAQGPQENQCCLRLYYLPILIRPE